MARLHKSLFAGKVGKCIVTYVTIFFIVVSFIHISDFSKPRGMNR